VNPSVRARPGRTGGPRGDSAPYGIRRIISSPLPRIAMRVPIIAIILSLAACGETRGAPPSANAAETRQFSGGGR